jgi:uracil-DNA glycosylase
VSLSHLLREINACRVCEANLPHGPRPVLRVSTGASLLIISQAPGSKVHQTGIPWNDASGDRLREWMNMDRCTFYDETRVAFVPIGFCYPGADPKGGDKPPRPECAALWHGRILEHLPNIQLTLLVGQYSQKHYLRSRRKKSMTETVKAFPEYGPTFFPLPHPSWRSGVWMRKQPWFEQVVIPKLRSTVRRVIA